MIPHTTMTRDKNPVSRILFLSIFLLLGSVQIAYGFVTLSAPVKIIDHNTAPPSKTITACFMVQSNPFRGLLDIKLPSVPSFPGVNGGSPTESIDRFCKARELVKSLVEEEQCFSTESGAIAFGNVCSSDCVYEDCYEPMPFVGREVSVVRKRNSLYIDVLELILCSYTMRHHSPSKHNMNCNI